MFRSLGYFDKITCPRQHECNLQRCIFSHELSGNQNGTTDHDIYNPFSTGQLELPPKKRRRIESSESEVKAETDGVIQSSSVKLIQQSLKAASTAGQAKTDEERSKPVDQRAQQLTMSTKTSELKSVARMVSPPPKQKPNTAVVDKLEKLIPRPVAQAPATLKVRMSLIEVLYKQMKLLNEQVDREDTLSSLSDQQVIKAVLDEEETAAAKLGSDIYRNAMAQRVLQFKKMKKEEWRNFVGEKWHSTKAKDQEKDQIASALNPEEETQILRYLRTNLTGLDAHGYVTKAPNTSDLQKAKDAIKAANGWEVCDRCGIRFQVFPGRDDQGRLTTKGECRYHWAKLNRGQRQRTDHITGQQQSSFPCCGQLPGTEGCTHGETHVFKVGDPKRLAALLQFEQTPPKSDGKKREPVAFDCEMAYTTHGMEVIRVTAVSWPQNKEVLDVLVRPYGEILDLNTRFSGVTQEQYTKALPYDITEVPVSNSEKSKVEAKPLRKVESPAVARQLMFNLLGPETPLIGHAIDNDLNTCRMVHPFVVDTVLLYPHPRGLPIRYGLKVLASKYLHRNIQSGGEAGHDSKEDSIATGDLVRLKVAEKWQMMRLQGWRFSGGILLPPGR